MVTYTYLSFQTAKQVQEDLKIEYMGNYRNGEVQVEKTMQQVNLFLSSVNILLPSV